jgi:hypothetical protein
MKKMHTVLSMMFCLMTGINSFASALDGAWAAEDGLQKTILFFKDGYFTSVSFSSIKFISAVGGTYKIDGNTIDYLKEFDSADSNEVGKNNQRDFSITGNQLSLTANGNAALYIRIDNGSAPLSGVWKITEREQDGKLVTIHKTGSRKTLKILTGSRFQWFAINPETKQFSGTGGGTYTFINGKYTENIQFFSRDNSRVGDKLTFDGKLEKNKWHHSGLSSKGDKIYEIWSRINH